MAGQVDVPMMAAMPLPPALAVESRPKRSCQPREFLGFQPQAEQSSLLLAATNPPPQDQGSQFNLKGAQELVNNVSEKAIDTEGRGEKRKTCHVANGDNVKSEVKGKK